MDDFHGNSLSTGTHNIQFKLVTHLHHNITTLWGGGQKAQPLIIKGWRQTTVLVAQTSVCLATHPSQLITSSRDIKKKTKKKTGLGVSKVSQRKQPFSTLKTRILFVLKVLPLCMFVPIYTAASHGVFTSLLEPPMNTKPIEEGTSRLTFGLSNNN